MALSIKDFSEKQEVSSDSIKKLVTSCEKVEVANEYIANLEAKLKEAKERRSHIIEIEIPEVMDEIGMEEFKLSNGKKITIKQIIAASMPVATREEGLTWLEKNNHGDIIKTQLQIKFNREQHDAAKELAENLMEEQYNVSISSAVNPQTLKSFVKEQIEGGSELPKDLFSIYLSRQAVIKG